MHDWLHALVQHICQRFGRSEAGDLVDDRLDTIDARLSTTERQQRDIAARVKLLEYQADPRGLGRPGGC